MLLSLTGASISVIDLRSGFIDGDLAIAKWIDNPAEKEIDEDDLDIDPCAREGFIDAHRSS